MRILNDISNRFALWPGVVLAVDWESWISKIPLPDPYKRYVVYALAALVALVILKRVLGVVSRAVRRSQPPTIHPKLQKYSVDQAEEARKQRELAVGVIATSTGNRLAGFRIVRQVEAVFVEGLKTPEDAVIALKATAVQRGANAIVNVHTDRTTAGRCTASGDAVVVAPMVAKMPQRPAATEPPVIQPPSPPPPPPRTPPPPPPPPPPPRPGAR